VLFNTVAERFVFSAGENTPHKAECLRSTGRQYRQRRFCQRRVFLRGCCRVLPLLTTEHRKAVAAEDGFWPSIVWAASDMGNVQVEFRRV